MTAPRATTKTESKGCTSCGSAFDDQLLPAVMEKAVVSRIVFTHNAEFINSILVGCSTTVPLALTTDD